MCTKLRLETKAVLIYIHYSVTGKKKTGWPYCVVLCSTDYVLCTLLLCDSKVQSSLFGIKKDCRDITLEQRGGCVNAYVYIIMRQRGIADN